MTKVLAELEEVPRVGPCITIRFGYHTRYTKICKDQLRAKLNSKNPDDIYWYIRQDLTQAKLMREYFGTDLTLGPNLKRWARQTLDLHDNLRSIQRAETAELSRLPNVLPQAYDFISQRWWQPIDVAFMAAAPSSLNCLDPRLGKTPEIICTPFEAGNDDGAHLVMAPVSSLEVVWGRHLAMWQQPYPVLILPDGRGRRVKTLQLAAELHAHGEPFWLVANPALATLRSDFDVCEDHDGSEKVDVLRKCFNCEEFYYQEWPELESIAWATKVCDEFHLCGLGNPSSLTHKGFAKIPSERTILTSGTPIGGKPLKLFGGLKLCYPKDFTSKERWANQWLVQTEVYDHKERKHVKYEGLRKDREEQFYEFISSYMIRRLRKDVAPELEDPDIENVYLPMTPSQNKQYREFETMAEVRIDDYDLSAVGVLAEYARLKQFANARQTVEITPNEDPDKPPIITIVPTEDSNKLPEIKRRLAELGITGDPETAGGEEQVLIYSESEKMIRMISNWLTKQGIDNGLITGPVARARRADLQRLFQAGELRVLCLQLQTGGVAIDLFKADTAYFVDESWNPDDVKQAIDRMIEMTKTRFVTAVFLRSKNSIQEYIEERVDDKRQINAHVLDFRARGYFHK